MTFSTWMQIILLERRINSQCIFSIAHKFVKVYNAIKSSASPYPFINDLTSLLMFRIEIIVFLKRHYCCAIYRHSVIMGFLNHELVLLNDCVRGRSEEHTSELQS